MKHKIEIAPNLAIYIDKERVIGSKPQGLFLTTEMIVSDDDLKRLSDRCLEVISDRNTENGSEILNNCELQKSCSTCGYSPMSASCDTCEGYSNWWALEQTEPQTGQPCDGCEYSKPYIEYKCTHHSCKFEDEPLTADYCDTCDHKGCEYCIADSSNPYCVPSNYHKVEDEPTVDYKL